MLPTLIVALLCSLFFADLNSQSIARVVEIKAKRFAYTPSEITLKKGERVLLRLSTEDVAHSLCVKPLNIHADITPGSVTDVKITPDVAGRFVGVCDHFCGVGHAQMQMVLNVAE